MTSYAFYLVQFSSLGCDRMVLPQKYVAKVVARERPENLDSDTAAFVTGVSSLTTHAKGML